MGKERGQRWGLGGGAGGNDGGFSLQRWRKQGAKQLRDEGSEKIKFHLLLTEGNFQIWLQVVKSSESPQASSHRNNSLARVRVYAKRQRNCAWPSGANLPYRWLP